MDAPKIVQQLANELGGKIESVGACPDGSGFATMSMPLPKTHWLYDAGYDKPPMPFRIGVDEAPKLNRSRQMWADDIRKAAKYAVRAATMNGKEMDFDPDAMLQNMVVGMLGYWTANGLSSLDGDDELAPVDDKERCQHGRGTHDYCQPCGRINSAS